MKRISECSINAAIQKALDDVILAHAPYDTGNLAHNGISFQHTGKTEWIIYVDEKKAPYMKYTNEDWSMFGAPLKGKANPNQGWWEREVPQFVIRLAATLGGRVV